MGDIVGSIRGIPSNDDAGCRNCASSDVETVDRGYFSPFFTKRVLRLELSTLDHYLEQRALNFGSPLMARGSHAIRRLLGCSAKGRRLLQHRSDVFVSLRVCGDCTFVGPEPEFTAEDLMPLYVDYRSSTYNQERIALEPEYAAIQHLVGKSPLEIASRVNNVDALLSLYVDLERVTTVLDWGGGEARFVPTMLRGCEVYVLELSDEPLSDETFLRVSAPSPEMKYDYIQACHLLEHVSSPRRLVQEMLRYAHPGTYLYLEVPVDASRAEIESLLAPEATGRRRLHEHLNLFNVDSLRALGKSLGLDELVVQETTLDFGWTSALVASGLFQVPPRVS